MGYTNRQPPEGINNVETGWQRDFVILVVGFFAVMALLIWLLVQVLGWSARWVPFSWEQALTRSLEETLEPNEQQVYLQTFADQLAEAGGLDESLSIVVHYEDRKTVNAFATLGGHVFILRGLLEEVETEQALAFVLAHEIAHVHYRHPVRAASRQLGFTVVMAMVFGRTDVGTLVGTGGHMAMLDYSRKQELEADAWALHAVHNLYGHVEDADALFRWLDQQTTSPPAWLSSHPNTRERIQYLNALAQEHGYPLEGETTPLPAWAQD
ncbi:M48 family metallopeptidase [Marinimicrobium sp. ABcell2]|uniref:M48 family metallopeptidase n=1 Tax=Marinimicrobium sp. ABcell2 TaxID=3069751 RepID=UPI0027B3B65A|nr:M48 family metallopeptidase [Marinimicrobium sp. ABcell2]MDQ2078374.1 M48 family metallopeptidase [Marinimicrobium sp. ABcell2]